MPRHSRYSIVALVLAVAFGLPFAAPVSAANDTITSMTLAGTPFAEDMAPLADRMTIKLVLARRARVWVSIRKPDGTRVRRLAGGVTLGAGSHSWTWNGINGAGVQAADGRYVARIAAENSLGRVRQDRPLRKGLPGIYPANPGAIVITVDPGHGGRYPGAVRDGFAEKDFNLDISLKLRDLLEHAGVQVVMTRTTDRAIDEPPTDHNGDGNFNRYDDDLLRNDIKNQVRADVAVHVHNNASTNPDARGTQVYTNRDRTWTALGTDLAALMVPEVVEALEAHRSPAFDPRDGGVRYGWYYYLGPYDPPFLPRPSLVTSVLSESLYLSNPSELEALKRPEVRLSIAAGIYLGLAAWLNSRDHGAGYATTAPPPASAVAGTAATYSLRVTNRGNLPAQGWTLRLGAVPAVPLYDGSGAPGQPIGSVDVPDGLQPGQSVDLTVAATAPAQAGSWLVKADIVTSAGSHLSDAGIVALQMPLTTTPAQ